MRTISVFLLAASGALSVLAHGADPSPDAPVHPRAAATVKDAKSYAQALQEWQTPEDVSTWIAARFGYDTARAVLLSETQRAASRQLSIYGPREFFDAPSGICVDLARFAVETLRSIDQRLNPRYLMIEFAPVTIAGNTFRMHWLASYRRDGQHYFLADSRRPGHIAGPYADVRTFIDEYARYRSREIVGFRELDSHERKQRSLASRQLRDGSQVTSP